MSKMSIENATSQLDSTSKRIDRLNRIYEQAETLADNIDRTTSASDSENRISTFSRLPLYLDLADRDRKIENRTTTREEYEQILRDGIKSRNGWAIYFTGSTESFADRLSVHLDEHLATPYVGGNK